MFPAAGHWHNLVSLIRCRIDCVKLGEVVFYSTRMVGWRPYGGGKGLAARCRVEELLDLECRGTASVGGGGGRDLPGTRLASSGFHFCDGFGNFALNGTGCSRCGWVVGDRSHAHLGGRLTSAVEKHPDTPEQLVDLSQDLFRGARELDRNRFLKLLWVVWAMETFGRRGGERAPELSKGEGEEAHTKEALRSQLSCRRFSAAPSTARSFYDGFEPGKHVNSPLQLLGLHACKTSCRLPRWLLTRPIPYRISCGAAMHVDCG